MSTGTMEDVAFRLAEKINADEGNHAQNKEAAARDYWFTLYAECLRVVKNQNQEPAPSAK